MSPSDGELLPKQSSVEVTFLIPCLNEAESLAGVIEEINRSFSSEFISYEILVADNGSADDSQRLAEAAGARVITVSERGYGAALSGGIAEAFGKYIVMGDADGSYLFEDSRAMIKLLRNGADLVMGDRFAGGIAPGAMPWLHRYLGNPVLSALGRLLFRVPIRDFHCGLRAFNASKVRALGLSSPGMEFASELVVQAQRASFRISEVPVRLEPDTRSRPPHLNTWRDGWRHLRFLFAYSPEWTFLFPASVAAILAFVITLLGWAGPIDAWGIEFSFRSSVVASTLALVAAVASWSFVLARSVLRPSWSRFAYSTEKFAAVSVVVTSVGLAVVASQFLSWSDDNFGLQTVGQDLLITIWGCFLVALGGISFFFSLLIGLARVRR